jgi:ABC-2 type transport system permease protein
MKPHRRHDPLKYLQIAKINLLNSTVYLTEFVMRAVFILVILFIFTHLWTAVYSSGGRIEGFTIAMMLWYLLLAESIVTSQTYIHHEICEEIQTGNIAYTLTRPMKYALYYLARSVSSGVVRFVITFGLGALLLLVLVGGIHVALSSIPYIIVLSILAFLIDFLFTFNIGLLGFWLENTRSIHWLFHKIVFMLGGMLIPLEVYPDWIANISKILPFSYIAYHPAKMFVQFDPSMVWTIILIQIAYIIILSGIATILYRYGIRRVSINGG